MNYYRIGNELNMKLLMLLLCSYFGLLFIVLGISIFLMVQFIIGIIMIILGIFLIVILLLYII